MKIIKVKSCAMCEYNYTIDNREYKAICEIEDKNIEASENHFPEWCPLEDYEA